MSKSIYDEALLDLRMNDSMRVAGQHVLTREQYSNVFKVLEQAQKQEKLLKLYKELSNYVDETTYAHKLPEITTLKIKIKVLENDENGGIVE